MKGSNFIMLAILAGVVLLNGVIASGQGIHLPRTDKFIELREFLREIGNKYDCHFTLEIGLHLGDHTQSLAYLYYKEGERPELKDKSLKNTLESLHKKVPNFTYRFSAFNPKIIHVIDTRLSKVKNYALDKAINDISFEGYVFDLVNTIGQKGINVSSRGAVDLLELGAVDDTAHIRIPTTKGIIRDILTNSLDLNQRGRVLWIAETEFGKDQTTFVRYLNRRF